MSGAFEALGGETVYSGRLVDVRMERFRHADGEEVSREIVRHRGAVAIVAHDEEHVWLVRQPREAVGGADLLEIPAGRLDVEGEQPLAAAQRELAEEIGCGARSWEPILSLLRERRLHRRARAPVPRHATCIRRRRDSEEEERIEIVPLAARRAAGRDRRVPRREDADRPDVAVAPSERSDCTAKERRWRRAKLMG